MRIVVKAPCRVDLAGGTLDIWPLYLHHPDAVTVNFAIDRYTTCDIQTRPGPITLRSLDQKKEESFGSLDELRAARKPRLPLLAHEMRFFSPPGGLTIETHSESPSGGGIAGSSALIIAMCGALNKLTNSGYGLEKIREIAQNTEAQIIRVPTGAQDYYRTYASVQRRHSTSLDPGGSRRSYRTNGVGLHRRAAQFRDQQLGGD